MVNQTSIRISFYLLNPKIPQTQLYVSISNKKQRLRFNTGNTFDTSYCNVRKKKGAKKLVKQNTALYFDYVEIIKKVKESLIQIQKKLGNPTLEEIKDAFYLQTGKTEPEPQITLAQAHHQFVEARKSGWSDGTMNIHLNLLTQMLEHQDEYGEITMNNLNEEFWRSFRDRYYVLKKKDFNNSINAKLKKLKQFMTFAHKKKLITCEIDFDELLKLEEIEVYKIALKQPEVEILLNLDLSKSPRLNKVRDLFILEVFTGQRFGDIPKLAKRENIFETSIHITQQKGNKRVGIPLYKKFKEHIPNILTKYPKGLPKISNVEFNRCIKDVCKIAQFNQEHSWVTLSGKKRETHIDFRYNLISSHTGRRTFATLAIKANIPIPAIMKVTGHTTNTVKQFFDYIKVDGADVEEHFEEFLN